MHATAMRLIAEGEARGEAKGEAKMLTTILQQKFGPLPQTILERLKQAAPGELEDWGVKLLNAPTLQAVFDAQARR